MAHAAVPASTTHQRPWIFGLLIAPVAVLSNGLISGALSFLLRQQGVSPARSAEIISLLILPQTIYFLWSPVTDFFVRRRTWLMIGSFIAGLSVWAAFQQNNLGGSRAVALMFFAACCTQLVVASCGGMMGEISSEDARRRASSIYQSGSLAFGALAIFVLTSLSEHLSQRTLGLVTAALVALPSLVAFAAPGQTGVQSGALGPTLRRIAGEFQTTFFRWRAVPYTLLMLGPMCTGAAIGLLPGVAQDYGVNGNQVAWMNGVGGALLTASGAMLAALIPARIRASIGYLSMGLLNAATLVVLWLGPLHPATYFAGATLYLLSIGACYATFTAVVLEFLGDSGKSGSGRYAIINSLGNIPVAYMTWADGRGYAHWGARGLAATEAVLSIAGAGLLLALLLSRRSRA